LSNNTSLRNKQHPDSKLEIEIKQLIVSTFDLGDMTVNEINSDDLLFGGGIGLDSIDALELGLALKSKYGIRIDPSSEQIAHYFTSVSCLAKMIEEWQCQRSCFP